MSPLQRRRLALAFIIVGVVLCALTGIGHGNIVTAGFDLTLGWLGLTAFGAAALVKL